MLKTPLLGNERELEMLLNLVGLLDQQLSELCDESISCTERDEFGYFDMMEQLTGLAMVACQTYIATVCGTLAIDKRTELLKGQLHSGGKTKVEVINHAANYWKHNNEWGNVRSDRRRHAIEEAFDSVGFPVGTDYPLSGVLTELCSPYQASLAILSDILKEWKSTLLCDIR